MNDSLVEVLSTERDGPQGQPTTWSDLVQISCGDAEVGRLEGADPAGTILRCRLGKVRVSMVDADPHRLVRDSRQVSSGSDGHISICHVLEGGAYVDQDGRQTVAKPGSLVAFDSTRAHALTVPERIRMMVVVLPHRIAQISPGDSHALTVSPWRGDHGAGALLSRMLSGLTDHMDELTGVTTDYVGDSITSLVTTLISERMSRHTDDSAAERRALLLRIQTFARENLADPDLDPAVVARRHHISLRYLQVLFQDNGTSPARWIREERLAGCDRDLRDPRFAHLAVAAIGLRWGLPDASQFSRLYRAEYGRTPREVRSAPESAVRDNAKTGALSVR